MRALAMRASRATVEPMQFAGLESRLLRGSRLVRKELRERCVSIALGQRPNTIVKAKARGVPPTRPPAAHADARAHRHTRAQKFAPRFTDTHAHKKEEEE